MLIENHTYWRYLTNRLDFEVHEKYRCDQKLKLHLQLLFS